MSTHRYALGQDLFFGAVGRLEAGNGRGQLHQSGDGSAGTAHAPGFQGQREGEQESHGGRLEPLADPDGPRDRHGHQKIHVRQQMTRRTPCLRQDVPKRS